MTAARRITPSTTWLLTRRCSERRFFLRACDVINAAFLYCLALAAAKYEFEIHGVVVMSNHYHLVVTDTSGRLSEFMAWLNATVAKVLNVFHGRGEPIWRPGSYSAVELVDADDVMNALVYLHSNPVAAGLVDRFESWPGVISSPEDIGVRSIEAARPTIFFRQPRRSKCGTKEVGGTRVLPAHASTPLVKPGMFNDTTDESFRELLRDRIREQVTNIHSIRSRKGLGWIGAERVKAQDPTSSPAGGTKPTRELNPQVAGRHPEVRADVRRSLAEFRRAYREAWTRLREGELDVEFPHGTYLLRVRHGVRCRSPAA